MNEVMVLIPRIIQLFIMLILGYVILKLKIIDMSFNKQVTRFVLYVSMPCMILVSAINQVGEKKEIQSVLFTFALAAIMYAVIAILSFFLCTLLRISKEDNGVYRFAITFSNLAFMGFPIADAVLGDKGVFYASIFNTVSVLFSFTYGVALMSSPREGGRRKFSLRDFFNPALVASLVALVIYFGDIRIPAVATDTLNTIGSVTSPLAMILIGTTLAGIPLREVFTDARAYLLVFVKQVILPAVMLVLMRLFIHDDFIISIAYIMLLMPAANNAVLFATEYGKSEKTAVKIVFLSTLASFILLPLMLLLQR